MRGMSRIGLVRILPFVAAAGMVLVAASPLVAAGSHAKKAAPSGVIIDGLYEEPNLLNPTEGPTETFGGIVMNSLFANLFYTTPSGKILPEIATTVPTIANGGISKNGLNYTFHLKHTKWSNGQPFTANDVKVTWQVIMSKGYVPASVVGWQDIQSISIANPYEFTIHLKTPFQPLIEDCFATAYPSIIPASVFQNLRGKAAADAKYAHDPTVTNGPFEFQQWIPGTSITVVDNPYWFGPKPKVKEIEFEIVTNQDTLLADMQAHSINVYWFVPIQQGSELQKTPGVTVSYANEAAWESATVNFRNPMFDMPNNPHVPDGITVRALQMAINQHVLIKDVWKGRALPLAADQPPDSWAHNPNLKPYPYDPKEAIKLLESQGFTMKGGWMYRDGKQFVVTYSTTSDNDWRAEDERLIQLWFKAIGIKMNIRDYPAQAYFGTVLPSGKNWDLGEFEYQEGLDAGAAMATLWTTGSNENFGDYSNPQLDALFTKQASELTQAERAATLRQAEVILHTDPPNVWLYAPQSIAATQGITGYSQNSWAYDTWDCWNWALKK
jgi:peptide/nickel transport system substrate-binding protein